MSVTIHAQKTRRTGRIEILLTDSHKARVRFSAIAFKLFCVALVLLETVAVSKCQELDSLKTPDLTKELERFDIAQCESGALVTFTALITPGEKPLAVKIDCLAQLAAWKPEATVIQQFDSFREVLLLLVNGHQLSETLNVLEPELQQLNFILDDGFIKVTSRNPSSPGFTGISTYSVDFAELVRQSPSIVLNRSHIPGGINFHDETKRGFFLPRSAVGEQFLGHPLQTYACFTKDGWCQVLGGILCDLKVSPRHEIAAAYPRSPSNLTLANAEGQALTPVRELGEIGSLLDSNSGSAKVLTEHWREIDRIMRAFNSGFDGQTEAYTAIKNLINQLNVDVDSVFSDHDVVILDPVARGFYLEQAAWNEEQGLSIITACFQLGHAYTEKEMRFALTARAASLGLGASAQEIDSVKRTIDEKGPALLRTAVAAHWDFPVTEEGIASVVTFLESARLPSARAEAMDALILLDEVGRIPEPRMATWLEENLVDAELPLRRRKLAFLMKTSSGRAYLLAKLADGSLPAEVQTLAKSVIRAHVAATQRLKRFDMISEAEIQQLEQAL